MSKESELLARTTPIPTDSEVQRECIRVAVLSALKEAQKESRRYFWGCVQQAIFWRVALSIIAGKVIWIVRLPR